MVAFSYVNGRYSPLAAAGISVEDRGFQLGDAVCETALFLNRHVVHLEQHLWRLRRNLAALFIAGLPSDAALRLIIGKLIAKARLRQGVLSMVVSRGSAPRQLAFPEGQGVPTLAITARPWSPGRHAMALEAGVAAVVRPDTRGARADLGSVELLPEVLATEEAHGAQAAEALLLRDGVLTGGAEADLWMVDGEGVLCTPPYAVATRPTVVRERLQTLLEQPLRERFFTLVELKAAREVFLTTPVAPILPVTAIDGKVVANGEPGPRTRHLAQRFWANVAQQTGWEVPFLPRR